MLFVLAKTVELLQSVALLPNQCCRDYQMKGPNNKFMVLFLLYFMSTSFAFAESVPLETISSLSNDLSEQVIAWRRDFHQHPELSNREFRTAKIVADHLEALGMEVQTGVAHTGVIGVLKGGKPGPVVLLRADMDGLPVPERNDLPFKSVAIGEYNGEEVPVMHACGHDSHVAMLMGVAGILAQMKDEMPGTVKFLSVRSRMPGKLAGRPGRAMPAWMISKSQCTVCRHTAHHPGWVSTAWLSPHRSLTPCRPLSAATWRSRSTPAL
jgi:hypothetical protein